MRAASSLAFALASALLFPTPAAQAQAPTALDLARQLNEAFVGVAERVTPSVVVIRVAQKLDPEARRHPLMEQMPEDWRERFDAWMEEQKRNRERFGPRFDGEGSGIIYRDDGFILTNAHVVDEAEKVRVKLHDGREFDAEVRGSDPDSDIAILKLKEAVPGLKPAKFGNSEKVRVGEFAIAIGAPYELEYSVTFGHISAKGRAGLTDRMMDEDFLQTDANINPGNSGGPLLNLDGEVVGVNSMIRGVGTGICFAIPSNLAREVADQLVETGKFRRSWLGVGLAELRGDSPFARRFPNLTNGVAITGVMAGGPAERAQLASEDIVLAVDGRSVASITQLRREVTRKRPGSDVKLDVQRDGKRIEVVVKTDAMPDADERMALANQGRRGNRPKPTPAPPADVEAMGLTVQTVDAELRGRFRLKESPGVVVTKVDPDGPLAEYGLREGDLVYEIDKKPVATASQFAEILGEAAARKKFTLRYQRSGEKLSAVVLPPKPPGK